MTRLPNLSTVLLAGLFVTGAFAPNLTAQEILMSGGTVVTS